MYQNFSLLLFWLAGLVALPCSFIRGQASEQAIDSLVRQLDEDEVSIEQLEILLQLTDIHFHNRNTAREELYGKRAKKLEQQLGPNPATVKTLHYLGRIANRQEAYSEALQYFFSALDTFAVFSDELFPEDEVWLLMDIGWTYFAQEQYLLSEKYYELALAQSALLENKILYAGALINVGTVYDKQGKVAEYLDAMETALSIYRGYGKSVSANHILDFMFSSIATTEPKKWCMFESAKLQQVLEKKEMLGDTNSLFYVMAKMHWVGCQFEANQASKKTYVAYDKIIRKVARVDDLENLDFLIDHLYEISHFVKQEERREHFQEVIQLVKTQGKDTSLLFLSNALEAKTKEEQNLLEKQNSLQFSIYFLLGLLLLLFLMAAAFFARQKRRQMSMQQQLLQRQIDSHFLRNSMSIVQANILRKDNEAALQNTSKISRLFDRFIGFSRWRYILLKDEITFLQDYIGLEQERLQHQFACEWDVDPVLFDRQVMIPPMLIQPLLENTIRHGKFHEQNQGLIRLTVKEISPQTIEIAVMNTRTQEPSAVSAFTLVENHSLAIIEKRLKLLRMGRLDFRQETSSTVVTITLRTGEK